MSEIIYKDEIHKLFYQVIHIVYKITYKISNEKLQLLIEDLEPSV